MSFMYLTTKRTCKAISNSRYPALIESLLILVSLLSTCMVSHDMTLDWPICATANPYQCHLKINVQVCAILVRRSFVIKRTTRTYKNAEYLDNNNNDTLVMDMTDALVKYKEACRSRYNHTLRLLHM